MARSFIGRTTVFQAVEESSILSRATKAFKEKGRFMLDTMELTDLEQELKFEPECEDEVCERNLPARWWTSHEGCGYFICDECRLEDQEIILECDMFEEPVHCGHCENANVPPEEIKFVPI